MRSGYSKKVNSRLTTGCCALIAAGVFVTPLNAADIAIDKIRVGRDNNTANNPFIQPQDNALAGGGRDQSIQFGDTLQGTSRDDLLIGRLGADVMFGGPGDDVLVGGLEHFNPLNRDRAFGGSGDDIFIWSPGDGSDLFSGGRGYDVVVFGLVGEFADSDSGVQFAVTQDQQAGIVALKRRTRLPIVDVTNSPGFCNVIDESASPDAKAELRALGVHDLVQFSLRGVANSFQSGEQSNDNGLRVTLHLNSVEVLICTNRDGGVVEILNLTTSPPTPLNLDHPCLRKLRNRLARIVR